MQRQKLGWLAVWLCLLIGVSGLLLNTGVASAQGVRPPPGPPAPKEPPQPPQPQTDREAGPPKEPSSPPDREPVPTQSIANTPVPRTTPTQSNVNTPPPPTAAPPIVAPPPAEPTAVSTSAPTVAATTIPMFAPMPGMIVLNEILPRAQNVDWDRNGIKNADDAWIELYNAGATSVDLSGWKIQADTTFVIPKDTVIAPHAFRVFFRGQTRLTLLAASPVRLLAPDNAVIESVRYPASGDDQVYARASDGGEPWRTGCVPSPATPNCAALLPNGRNTIAQTDFFRAHIASPAQPFDLAVALTNALLAIILALAMGFFGNLLNDAIEAHEERVARWFAPFTAIWRGIRALGERLAAGLHARRIGWLGFAIHLTVILLLYGVILAYLDPSFDLANNDALPLIMALALSTGLIGVLDDFAGYVYLRLRGSDAALRVHSGNVILAILSTLFSRLAGLAPGILLGSPAGIEDVRESNAGARLDLLAILAMSAFAVGAWLLAPLTQAEPWLNTLCLLIFACGVQTVFFELLPIKYMRGRGVFQFNRALWLVLFAATTALFLQTMLNPDGAFVSAFNSPNMVTLALAVIAFCLFSSAVWFYLQHAEKTETA